jgi:hypothetical protein
METMLDRLVLPERKAGSNFPPVIQYSKHDGFGRSSLWTAMPQIAGSL